MAWARWPSGRILENTSAVLEVKNATFTNLPTAAAVDVLYVVVVNIDDAEGTVVIQIGKSVTSGENRVAPDECSTVIVESLFKGDESGIVGVVIRVHLRGAASSITTATPLDSSGIL